MPNISNVELVRLQNIEKRYNEDLKVKVAKEFAEHFCNNLGTMLAITPFDKWPEFAKRVFEVSYDRMPTAAMIYKDLLPKN